MKRRLVLVICFLIFALSLRHNEFTGSVLKTSAHAGAGSESGGTALPYTFDLRGSIDLTRVHLPEYSWAGWKPATCMPNRCFCERIREGTIRQPVNTWSNLAFILVGLLVIAVASHDLSRAAQSRSSNPMRTRAAYPGLYGAVTILIGIGSMFYHASLAFAGQAVDIISIYLLTTFMLLYTLSRLIRIDGRAFFACYLALNVVLGWISVEWPVLRRYLFIVLLLAVLASEAIIRKKLRPKMNAAFLYAAIASLVGACSAWILDLTGIMCSPDSWLQGHAVWHVLMAAVVGFIYLYYRSEDGYATNRAMAYPIRQGCCPN